MINDQIGRVGILNRLQRLNKATRQIKTNENGILVANYKISPLALQQQFEQVNEMVTLSMVEDPQQQIENYNNEVDELVIQLLQVKDDIAYQDLIIELVTLYPQFKGVFNNE